MGKGEESLKRFLDGDENAFGEVLGLYFDNLTFFINGSSTASTFTPQTEPVINSARGL